MAYQPNSNDDIPDWLKDFPENSGDDSETDPIISSDDEKDGTDSQEHLSPDADMPDDISDVNEDIPQYSDDEAPNWLKNIRKLQSQTKPPQVSDEELDSKTTDSHGNDTPLIIEEPKNPEELSQKETDESNEDNSSNVDETQKTPKWLENIRLDQSKLPQSDEENLINEDWLDTVRDMHLEETQKQNIFKEESENKTEEETLPDKIESTPNWLDQVSEEDDTDDLELSEDGDLDNDMPTWLKEIIKGRRDEKENSLTSDHINSSTDDGSELKENSEENLEDQEKSDLEWAEQFKMDGINSQPEQIHEWPLASPEFDNEESIQKEEAAQIEKPQLSEDAAKKPLLDISDHLPSEEAVKKITPPINPTQNISLTDIQELHVSYIFDLLKSENAGQKIRNLKLPKPQRLIQVLLTLALIIGIIFPIFGGSTTPKPTSSSESSMSFYDEIENLSEGDRVLVAIDYQPGFVGELESGAGSVLEMVLTKGASISFISTLPSGPAMIEHLVTSQLLDQNLKSSEEYSSIGYIAGGSAALLRFAEDPQRIAIDYFQNDASKSQIRSITDYSLILVITDDLSIALAWLEQLQPKLIDSMNSKNISPFLMLTSAQLESIMYPYFSTYPQKIDGYISGIKGISQFEALSGDSSENDLWNGYSRGITITILMIIFGSAYQLITSRFATPQRLQDN